MSLETVTSPSNLSFFLLFLTPFFLLIFSLNACLVSFLISRFFESYHLRRARNVSSISQSYSLVLSSSFIVISCNHYWMQFPTSILSLSPYRPPLPLCFTLSSIVFLFKTFCFRLFSAFWNNKRYIDVTSSFVIRCAYNICSLCIY